MKRFREAAILRSAVLGLALVGFALAAMMSVSADVHEWFHQDASHSQHECLATTLHSGGCDHSTPDPLLVITHVVAITDVPTLHVEWVESLFLRSQPLDRGPPPVC